MTYLYDALKGLFRERFEGSPSQAQPGLILLSPQLSFPPPAFIRPQHHQMTAREEKFVWRAPRKGKLAPDVLTSQSTYDEALVSAWSQSPSEREPAPRSPVSREIRNHLPAQSEKLSPLLAIFDHIRALSARTPCHLFDVALQKHPKDNNSTVPSLNHKNRTGLPHGISPTQHKNSDLDAMGNAQSESQPRFMGPREPDLHDFPSPRSNDIAKPTNINSANSQSRRITIGLRMPLSGILELTSSLSTLRPPGISEATKAAAVETARIASLYDLDLAYFVELWPTGRLLAAYGLDHLPPYNVGVATFGSDVGAKVPKKTAVSYYFAWGRTFVFYPRRDKTGKFGGLGISTAESGFPGKGGHCIVFAAYRKPMEDGRQTDQCFEPEISSDLYKDAERLVQMFTAT